MAPVLRKLNLKVGERAFIKYVDVWVNTGARGDVPVSAVPTQAFFGADGKPFIPSDELALEIPFDAVISRDTGERAYTVHVGALSEEQFLRILSEMGVSFDD